MAHVTVSAQTWAPGQTDLVGVAPSAGETSASQAPSGASEGQHPPPPPAGPPCTPALQPSPLSPGDVHTDPIGGPAPGRSPAQPPASGSPPAGTAFASALRPPYPDLAQGRHRCTWGPRQDGTLSSVPHPEPKRRRRVTPRCRHRCRGGCHRQPAVLPPRWEARGKASPALGTGRTRPPGQDTPAAGPGPPRLPGLAVAPGKGAAAPLARGTRPLRPRGGGSLTPRQGRRL